MPPDPFLSAARRLALVATCVLAAGSCRRDSEGAPLAAAVCGNGVREAGEDCDDGNANNADGCYVTCRQPVVFVPSDVHVHSTGCGHPTTPAGLAEKLKAQGLQVGASLAWGWDFDDAAQYFTGRDHPLSTANFILHYDLEVSRFAAARTGHLLLLGLDSLSFSPDLVNIPQSGVPVVEWARRQPRAVVGMAHAQYWPKDGSFPLPPGGCCVPFEVVVHAVRGRLDFLSMERSLEEEPGTWLLWKALQNSGFRIPITGASDYSCFSESFDSTTLRTDVIVDDALSYDGWLRAIKAGRTVAAAGAGNRLNLRVEGRLIGDEVQLAAAQDVAVVVETAGAPSTVDILVNGDVAGRVAMAAGVQVVETRVRIGKSSWIAARSPSMVTSPVYVVVEGRPIRPSPDDVCYLQRSVEHLQDLVTSRRLRLFDSTEEALRAYGEAVTELRRRFTESGGVVCR